MAYCGISLRVGAFAKPFRAWLRWAETSMMAARSSASTPTPTRTGVDKDGGFQLPVRGATEAGGDGVLVRVALSLSHNLDLTEGVCGSKVRVSGDDIALAFFPSRGRVWRYG